MYDVVLTELLHRVYMTYIFVAPKMFVVRQHPHEKCRSCTVIVRIKLQAYLANLTIYVLCQWQGSLMTHQAVLTTHQAVLTTFLGRL